jgi:signal transduction histidine kinase
MRWSIRHQILVPLIAIQTVAVTATTLATAALAARRTERQIIGRLNGVIDTLGHANFPYTASVLAKMRGLTGAHLVAYTDDGRVTESSLPSMKQIPPFLRDLPRAAHLETLGSSPALRLDGTGYRAVALRSGHGLRGTSLLVLYPETSWRQARWDSAMPPLTLGLGSLGLMIMITSLIAHRISRRIGRVQEQVAQIAAGRFRQLDLGRERERDEVDDLSRSINRMCAQLSEMRQTIQQSERTRLLAQLAAGLAHQMRNSLTGARMSVQLHARRFPAQAGDRSLEVALRQLAMTEEQVKGLLSLGRVESRLPEVCDLRRLLREIALLIDPACQHAKVALDVRGEGPPLEVIAEESGLRAATLNLALNAIEAAGRGGQVRLEALGDGESATIEVSDTGPGPPPELADCLFEPFTTSKPEGVGLGLALAHEVASRNGGTLSWTRAGLETRFRLSLPGVQGSVREAV